MCWDSTLKTLQTEEEETVGMEEVGQMDVMIDLSICSVLDTTPGEEISLFPFEQSRHSLVVIMWLIKTRCAHTSDFTTFSHNFSTYNLLHG